MYEDFDGFVILHGTDTLAYTAAALSFMLENLGKPVVITGSQVGHHCINYGITISKKKNITLSYVTLD